jgi:uncharacterized RDD family membrane protein YckC
MAIQYEDSLRISSAGGMRMEYPIAGLGSRTYAFTVDWHIRVILVLAWYFLVYLVGIGLSLVWGDSFKLSSASGKLVGYLVVLPSALIYLLYHPVLEFLMKGRTPGKRMAGVRLVTLDGAVPGLAPVIVRNLFRLLDTLPSFYLVGIGTCLLTPRQVRIGDIAARTVLIHEEVMQDRAIELMSHAAHQSGLSVAQVEVLHDLLGRWKQLEREKRIALGQRLLDAAGRPVAEQTSFSGLDARVHGALLDLAGGNK